MGDDRPDPGARPRAAAPLLDLADEPRLWGRGSVPVRRIGAALLVLGVLLVLADRRLVQVGMPNWFAGTSITVLLLGGVALLLGAAVFGVSFAWPRRPRVDTLPLELDRLRRMVAKEQTRAAVGWSLVGVAAAVAAYGVTSPVPADALLFVPVAAVSGAIGAVLLIQSSARVPLARLLLVQGLRPIHPGTLDASTADPRVAQVLQKLDQLLGELPEPTVRAFMAAPESALYLELLEESLRAPAPAPAAAPVETVDGAGEEADPAQQAPAGAAALAASPVPPAPTAHDDLPSTSPEILRFDASGTDEPMLHPEEDRPSTAPAEATTDLAEVSDDPSLEKEDLDEERDLAAILEARQAETKGALRGQADSTDEAAELASRIVPGRRRAPFDAEAQDA